MTMNKKILAVIAVVIVVVALIGAALIMGGKKTEPGTTKPPKKNQAPMPAFTMSATRIPHNLNVTFDASASSDPDGNNITCSWSLGDGGTATGKVVVHAYAMDGNIIVNLTVSDGKLSNSTSKTLEVYNAAPVITDAIPAAASATILEGDGLNFTANATDGNGDPLSFSWALNNASAGTGQAYSFVSNYSSAGTYTVRVTASDGKLSAIREWQLTVTDVNRPPAITAFDPLDNVTILEGASAVLSATAYDPDADVLTYVWKLDGVQAANGTGTTAGFTYSADDNASGLHSVSVSYTDGKATATRSWGINVTNVNRAPVITGFTPSTDTEIIETYSKDFSINASDADGDFLTYNWTLDGTTVSVTAAYTMLTDYSSAGCYTLIVTVSDGAASDSQRWNVTVLNMNRMPTAVLIADPLNVTVGENITFNASGSWDPDNETLVFEWTFGDGNLSSQIVAVHAFMATGDYKVYLSVTDPFGGKSITSVDIDVSPLPPQSNFSEVWNIGPFGEPPQVMLVGDVDADSVLEIVLATNNGTDSNNVTHGHIAIFDYNTRALEWRSLDYGAVISIALANLDGDAALEIVAGIGTNSSGDMLNGTTMRGRLMIFDGATHAMDKDIEAPGLIVSLLVADIGGNAQLEILASYNYNASFNMTTFSLQMKGGLAVYDNTLLMLWNSTGWGMTMLMAAENLDADAQIEILAYTLSNASLMGGGGTTNMSVYEWVGGAPSQTATYTEPGGFMPNIFLVADADGDGGKEILAGTSGSSGGTFSGKLYIFETTLAAPWISGNIGGVSAIAVGETDGVVGNEVLVGIVDSQAQSKFTGKVIVFSSAMAEQWRTGNIGRAGVIATSDINADGTVEIVIGAVSLLSGTGRSNGTLHIFSGKTHKELINATGLHEFNAKCFLLVGRQGGGFDILFTDWNDLDNIGYIRLYRFD